MPVRAAARASSIATAISRLFWPRDGARDGLMALAAFHGEIARIPLTVRESAIGDIRLQWWRDALLTPASSATGNPAGRRHAGNHARARALRGEMLIKIINA